MALDCYCPTKFNTIESDARGKILPFVRALEGAPVELLNNGLDGGRLLATRSCTPCHHTLHDSFWGHANGSRSNGAAILSNKSHHVWLGPTPSSPRGRVAARRSGAEFALYGARLCLRARGRVCIYESEK